MNDNKQATFDSLGLTPELLRALKDQGHETPTPIQNSVIPAFLKGQDIVAGAQTGTGKTGGFALPILQKLQALHKRQEEEKKQTQRKPKALILTPTRELADQVGQSISKYGKYTDARCITIFGGVNMHGQIKKIQRGADIIIATPGRLLDHVRRRNINLSTIEMLVLDEADRMLDMGFIDDIRHILKQLANNRQNAMFSATYSSKIKALANELLKNPQVIEVSRQNTVPKTVTQIVYPVDQNGKRALLSHIIGSQNLQKVLVFSRTKHGADRLTDQLNQDGLSAIAIHSNKSQGARSRALGDFRNGKCNILVATDVAARGLDIKELPHVINFDLPDSPEDYLHRIGRTGRANNNGTAVSLVGNHERRQLRNIEELLKDTIRQEVIAGFGTALAPSSKYKGKSKPRPHRQRQQGNNAYSSQGNKAKPFRHRANPAANEPTAEGPSRKRNASVGDRPKYGKPASRSHTQTAEGANNKNRHPSDRPKYGKPASRSHAPTADGANNKNRHPSDRPKYGKPASRSHAPTADGANNKKRHPSDRPKYGKPASRNPAAKQSNAYAHQNKHKKKEIA
jgi:ATP-dependent RNA helicase RhlE